MATDEVVNKLKEVEQVYLSINKDKLLRINLGEESLATQLEPIFEELNNKYDFAHKHGKSVHDNYLNDIVNNFSNINNQLLEQSGNSNQDYIAMKGPFLAACNKSLQQLKLHWHVLIAAGVEDRGLLHDEGILKQYEKTVISLKEESEAIIQNIQSEAEKTIENAKKLADEIETKARRTATKISVKAAQDQFSSANKPLAAMTLIWAVICALTIWFFFDTINKYLDLQLPDQWTWQAVYYASIRLAMLGAIGAISAFSLKIFKSSLHMYLHNKHRIRLTNSIEAFVESAVTPEQRDMILAQLVESIASFGNSGLLNQDGTTDNGPKMTIDNITRPFRDISRPNT